MQQGGIRLAVTKCLAQLVVSGAQAQLQSTQSGQASDAATLQMIDWLTRLLFDTHVHVVSRNNGMPPRQEALRDDKTKSWISF